MKRPLAWWAARAGIADRLARGSYAVWEQRTDALTAWVRRGRRDDLDGWRAALGPLARLALLGAVAYMTWAIVRALPWLMWLLAGWWIGAAWKAGKGTVSEADEDGAAAPRHTAPEEVREATLEWIWRLIGDRQGVHLRDLLAHAHAHHMLQDLDVAAFRTHLERWQIPVRARVRVRGLGVTVGIHRDDLEGLTSPSPAAVAQDAA